MVRLLSGRSALAGGGLFAAVGLAATCVVAGCTTGESSASAGPMAGVRIMAPVKSGGGWDVTSKAMAQALDTEQLASEVKVFNVDGDGGIKGLQQLSKEQDDKLLMTMGQVLVGSIEQLKSDVSVSRDCTPIARTVDETLVLAVPAGAPYDTMEQFLTAWHAAPKDMVFTGGSLGSADEIVLGKIAERVGIDSGQVHYVASSGAGESKDRLLRGEVKAGVGGVAEYKKDIMDGKLRALAVSGARRSALLPSVRTLKEQGLGVVYTKWRGVVARPGISEAAKKNLVDMMTRLHASDSWKKVLRDNDWSDAFLTGGDYSKFLQDEQDSVRSMLAEIGSLK